MAACENASAAPAHISSSGTSALLCERPSDELHRSAFLMGNLDGSGSEWRGIGGLQRQIAFTAS